MMQLGFDSPLVLQGWIGTLVALSLGCKTSNWISVVGLEILELVHVCQANSLSVHPPGRRGYAVEAVMV